MKNQRVVRGGADGWLLYLVWLEGGRALGTEFKRAEGNRGAGVGLRRNEESER